MSNVTAADLSIDLRREPFSRRESRWVVAFGQRPPLQKDALYIRHIYAGSSTDLYRIDLDSDYAIEAHPAVVRLAKRGGGTVEIAITEPEVLRIRSKGTGFTLRISEAISEASQWEEIFPYKGGWNAFIRRVKHHVAVLAGTPRINAPWGPKSEGSHRHHRCSPFELSFDGDEVDVVLEEYESEWDERTYARDFDVAVAAVTDEFASWLSAGPKIVDSYAEAATRAEYVRWAAINPASGNFHDPTMLMSKQWMNNAWNWDNYFNAWATTYRDPQFALRQYHLHIDHQHAQGALGDGINESTVGWTYTKPPVHGWILGRMLAIHEYTNQELAPLYDALCRWTDWWFTYRDDDNDGICQYHHGNDSGWDDASAFDVTPPVESPDLTALLIIQMEVLSQLATRLGKPADAERWLERSKETLASFIDHSFQDGQFVSMQSGTHKRPSNGGDSLLCYIPMVLGHRLPQEHRSALVGALSDEGRFLLDHGLATESARSSHFIAEGYWRGPMWAPALMIIVDGLLDAGETELAKEIARRFCDDCVTGGFAECYNAQTGAPIHDPAYTWAASVFIILAQLF